MNLKLIKHNLKHNFLTVEKLKSVDYIQAQKSIIDKINDLNELNKLTNNFNTDLIIESMNSFIEIEKIKKYVSKL